MPPHLVAGLERASRVYGYRGVPLVKNPFDFALYPLLLWDQKPRTIIEVGSAAGGSALWLADLSRAFGTDAHIYSVDIRPVTTLRDARITFLQGDARALDRALDAEWLRSLPRPLLVIDDADHARESTLAILEFFHPHLRAGEYAVVEDAMSADGPRQAIRAFLAAHADDYAVDSRYCDFFGYNATWCVNGYLRRLGGHTPAAPPSSAGAASDRNTKMYLDLLKRILLNTIFPEQEDTLLEQRAAGTVWPKLAHTMIGRTRLETIERLLGDVLARNVDGDFVETGVWRGGACIFARGCLHVHGVRDRTVWVVDSFQGLPSVTGAQSDHEFPFDMDPNRRLAVSKEEVENNFAKYGLLDDSVRFIEGWFAQSLPDNPIERISVLRVDCDLYDSTTQVLTHLYDKVSPGGYIIIDDYGVLHCCRQAVDDFRLARSIGSPLVQTDHSEVYWQKD